MEATQLIDDSILEESEEEEDGEKRGEPLAKLRVLKNKHITETELPLYQGENVLGRNPDSCSLPLVARSVSKQHTIISISMFRGNRRHGNVAAMETEALVWDLGSMNGTRKGRTKLTPHVRYALTEGECVVIADIPCQYVSVDQRGGQGHMQNPTNAHSGRRSGPDRKAQLRGSPSGQGLGRETGTPKTEGRGVNGEIGAPSLTELGGKGKNLAKPLSFEQTPTQPERTLVPESDSDGEQEGRRDKRGKYFVSDSDSHMSSPTCSTFLSPTTNVIPESEDESPITPSSSAINRPKTIVSFSEEESDMDGPRQQPRRRRAQVIVDDSEEEEEGKEGTEALGEKEPGKRTRGKEEVSVDTFNMDSDTDVEGEEEMGLSAPVNAVKPPAATEPPTTDSDPGQIHMDSDTDVEEGDTMDSDSKLMLTAADVERKPVDSVPVVQPTEIHLDSDTDVDDDDDVVVSDSATNVTSFVSDPAEKPDNPAPAVPPVEFHLDTDTDVEEEDTDTHSKTVPESDSSGIRTGIAGPQEILLDSDTDEEDNPFTPPASSRTAELLNPPTSVRPAAAAPLEVRSDSDTDLEEDATQTMNLPPPNVTTVTEDAVFASRQAVLPSPTITTTTGAVTKTIALRSQDSDADTDAQNQGHQSSLPVEPTLDATQPYGLEPSLGEEQPSRGSFQLGLSDSSHLHLQARDQASESTQAFSFPGGDSDLEATQTYGSGGRSEEPCLGQRSAVFRRNRQGDSDLEATQTYGSRGGSEEPGLGQRSAVFERNRQVDFALEATQAYAAQPRSDTEEEDEEETPTTSNVATTETLPMSAYEEEDSEEEEDLVGAKPLTPVRRGRSGGAREREEEEQETQTGEVLTNQYLSTAQTLDMVQESDDEEEAKPDSPRRRRTQKQTVDEEERQTVSSYLSTAETQPMFTAAAAEDDDDNEEEELKPPSPRRRGRSQRGRVEEEETQPSEFLTSSHISTAETQPMGTCDTEEEEEEDTKAKGQAQRERGKESEAGTSGVSSRGRRGARGGEEESSETLKTQMRGKGKAVNTAGGGGRREVLPEEEESEKEEEAEVVEQGRRGIGRKSVKQQKEGEKERLEEERREEEEGIEKERQEQAEKERLQKEKVESERVMKEQQDRERMEQELKEQDERLESVEREETERMEREKREQEKREETERMEKREQEKREETERMEREKREQEKREETERMEREKREQEKREETERMEREKREQEKREETERMEREKREQEKREETERMEREKREQEKREETERMEREKREETERMEKEKREETERMEREKREETERMEREKREQEKREQLERERKEREEQERLQCERTKREKKERLEEEKERIERERKEIEERNRLEREEKEKQERLERENREREALERSERERVEKERIEGEQAEKQRLEKEKMEREEKRKQERELLKKKKEEERNLKEKLEREKKEREKREAEEKEKEIKERQAKEQGEKQAKKDDENELKTSRRGRRAATRRTVTVPPTTEPQPELNILSSTPEPVPASITRSRSNSSNSVSSERSSIDTLGSRGRGGRKTTSTTEPAPDPDNPTRNSTRKRTLVGTVVAPPAAVEVTAQDILSSEQFPSLPLPHPSLPPSVLLSLTPTPPSQVLFTGVVDEEGGKVVSCLGGSLAKGVADMTHLVTDRVRRTVKFLCAVARGMPVVTTDWLDKCGKVGHFLPTDRYLVKDREQENKFSFCLEESLRTASTQPLLQGYEVHVTRSVLPEPAQMKDIIICSGARYLSTMPSTQKAQARTLVISCGEDWSLCAPALSASLPVLSAEFLLTGILQQRVDLVTHVLSAPKPRAQPGAKGQARGRKRM
uniref:Mediator of DNA damage checkpoint protein 1 n=1 Tax=Oncorhynchus mykiss TaxID=8022 RepID=A0A8C7PGG0_ONCMY